MNFLEIHFLSKIKELYRSENFSDGILDIVEEHIEINDIITEEISDSNQNQSLGRIQHAYASYPIHFMIISTQSDYFSTMILNSANNEAQEKRIKIVVKENEGKTLDTLIKCFYDYQFLDSLTAFELLQVALLADIYGCCIILQKINSKRLRIRDGMKECGDILKLIKERAHHENLTEIFEKFSQLCIQFVLFKVVPLETKNSKDLLELSFEALQAILASQEGLAYHENSILYFVILWLKHDVTRQTGDVIKSLLYEINVKKLTLAFLNDVISDRHPILSKWEDFAAWYLQALTCNSFSAKRPCFGNFIKNFPSDFNRSIPYRNNTLLLPSELQKDRDLHFVAKQNFYYQGYHLVPSIRLMRCSPDQYMMCLRINIENFHDSIDEVIPLDSILLEFDVGLVIYPLNTSIPDRLTIQFLDKYARGMHFKFTLEERGNYKAIGTIDFQYFSGLNENRNMMALLFLPQDAHRALKKTPFNIKFESS